MTKKPLIQETGRINRSSYLVSNIVGTVLACSFYVAVVMILSLLFSNESAITVVVSILAAILTWVTLLIYVFRLAMLRVRDIGVSSYWAYLIFTPFSIVMVFICLLMKGEDEDNDYGVPPLPLPIVYSRVW